ncbi:RNA polymerase sigma-70 factor [Carboxylicivirga sp. A043]|uniref:RNA polymerase sigma-70 factor n=1 Tax=Carboxylicivirga litoralis TaxID=2816963 RepID=UPI0021CB985E|nr:RNA polymerase sigma-70 factor [Carboxylicivirga sp. A043]MCU4156046.1 RNA polymerase sigma-70 factor [Carboxylicivirga sp. A043]
MDKTNNPQILWNALKANDKAAFDKLFKMLYPSLCRFAHTITHSTLLAEEAVQNIFVTLWEKRLQLNQVDNIKSYLFKTTYNQCLWLLKKNKTQKFYENQYALEAPSELSLEEKENWEAFRPHIEKAVSNLPDKCRQIFLLRRYEGLTNAEIADYLNISVKTVENQLSIAIQKLRTELHPFIKSLLILFFIENL